MTVLITLTKGKSTIVDEADYSRVAGVNWQAHDDDGRWYAVSRGTLRMHRVILGAPDGVQVDHINGDGLDNRRANLRLATHRQNTLNRARRGDGFKGVSRRQGRWLARAGRNGQFYLGHFGTPEEAARAYDAKARELYGAFARLNFPETVP